MSNRIYSIKDLERVSKLKAHTIRIWEKRYGLFSPTRTAGNIRKYSESDIRKLLNVSVLYSKGMKISAIAQLSEDELQDRTVALIQDENSAGSKQQLARLLRCMMVYDAEEVISLLRKAAASMSWIAWYSEIVQPLLQEIGRLWQLGTIRIAHEHMVSLAIRQVLVHAIHEENTPVDASKPQVLLLLHEEEWHEFPLLLQHLLLKQAGYPCCYLGCNIPMKEIAEIVDAVNPEWIVTSFTSRYSEHEEVEIAKVFSKFDENIRCLISGSELPLFFQELGLNYRKIESLEQFSTLLQCHKGS